MEPFKGLALGVFLITVGMGIDLFSIWQNLGTIALAVVAVLLLKALITGGLLWLSGARRGIAIETGILMSSPSETTLIVLAAAASAALIDPETAQFWKIVTAIGLTITPMLAKLGNHAGQARRARAGRAADRCRERPAAGDHRRLRPRRPARGADAHAPRQALRGDRFGHRPDRAMQARRLQRGVRQRGAGRRARQARRRACAGGDPDDGRAGPGAADRAQAARRLSGAADHRPRARQRARRRAVQGRREHRRARDARSLAAALRSGAGRLGGADGPGDRLDPREARRVPRTDHGRRRARLQTQAAHGRAAG